MKHWAIIKGIRFQNTIAGIDPDYIRDGENYYFRISDSEVTFFLLKHPGARLDVFVNKENADKRFEDIKRYDRILEKLRDKNFRKKAMRCKDKFTFENEEYIITHRDEF